LRNIERLSGLYRRAAFVFVENDSLDDTRSLLRQWLLGRANGELLTLDGPLAAHPSRTVRLAAARNAYLSHVRGSDLGSYDELVVMDLDAINGPPVDPGAFEAASSFLHADEATSAVFASSKPVYFDIWALRHPIWCPNDCWAEVMAARGMPHEEAVQRYVYARQIPLDPDRPPIPVLSAFGGLGIYRMDRVLQQEYIGLTSVGTEVCEHVSLNLGLSRTGRLYVFPRLQCEVPEEHRQPQWRKSTGSTLDQSGNGTRSMAPASTPSRQLAGAELREGATTVPSTQYFVVHFHKLAERRQYLEGRFSEAGIEARFIEVELSNPDLPRVLYAGDELEWYRKTRGLYPQVPGFRRLSVAEIHNAASHVLAIHSIDSDWGVILEDDVILDPGFFATAQERLAALPTRVGCAFLGGGFPHESVTTTIAEYPGFHLKAHPATNTVVAYALRKGVAGQLARNMRGFDLPFDYELSHLLMSQNVLVAHLLPYVAREGSKTGVYQSAIEPGRSE
jgi:GR25 family glycosyltransferase involved in LPS biosynthesis